jgi:hypothetical protein
MADDKMQPASNDRPRPTRPKQSGEGAGQPQDGGTDTPVQPDRRQLTGRKPLFRS